MYYIKHESNPRKATAFELTQCDCCGVDCQVNATTLEFPFAIIPNTELHTILGIFFPYDKGVVPGEIGYCEALEAAVCDDCYVEEEA